MMRVVSLGRPALFLIPSVKAYHHKYFKARASVARRIHRFCVDNFGGYNCLSGNVFGYYRSMKILKRAIDEYDELRQYKVAFKEDANRTLVRKLQKFLEKICREIGEECIYLECGEDAMLVYSD